MWRAIGPEDFSQASALFKNRNERGLWLVCEDYSVDEGRIVAKHRFSWSDQGGRVYMPLEEEPNLFLKFANLSRSPDYERAALAFCQRYGIPGCLRRGSNERWLLDGVELEARQDEIGLDRLAEEARRAWLILGIYQLSLLDDENEIKLFLTEHGEALREWPFHLSPDPLLSESPGEVSAVLLMLASYVVAETVSIICRPQIIVQQGGNGAPTTSGGWLFNDLLGAMYLQMYWLMASSADLTRCDHCARMISLARPNARGRKRRRDKRFCDDACRQAHYRSKMKP